MFRSFEEDTLRHRYIYIETKEIRTFFIFFFFSLLTSCKVFAKIKFVIFMVLSCVFFYYYWLTCDGEKSKKKIISDKIYRKFDH